MEDMYKVEIVDSLRPLSVKDKLKFKGNIDAKKLSELVKEDGFDVLGVTNIIALEIHNPKSKDTKDYGVTYFVDKEGTVYSTSSDSVASCAVSILMLSEEDIEELGDLDLHFFRRESKNNVEPMILFNLA